MGDNTLERNGWRKRRRSWAPTPKNALRHLLDHHLVNLHSGFPAADHERVLTAAAKPSGGRCHYKALRLCECSRLCPRPRQKIMWRQASCLPVRAGILPPGIWLSILEPENLCWIIPAFSLGLEARLTVRQDACRHSTLNYGARRPGLLRKT